MARMQKTVSLGFSITLIRQDCILEGVHDRKLNEPACKTSLKRCALGTVVVCTGPGAISISNPTFFRCIIGLILG